MDGNSRAKRKRRTPRQPSQFDVRILPGFSPEAFLEELIGQLDTEAEFEILDSGPLGPAEPDMGLYPLLADILEQGRPEGFATPLVLQAVTDARFFNQLRIQTYGFTPLQLPADLDVSRMAHGVDERIPVDSVEFGTQAIVELIKRYGRL